MKKDTIAAESSQIDSLLVGRAFLDLLQEGIWIADSEERIVLVNRAFLRLVACNSPEAILGKLWRELIPPAEYGRLARGRPSDDIYISGNAHIALRDGHTVPVSIVVMRRT
ncbi:MAG: PAS domain-containing protein, partial [candidate division WOR-3 bacterium]